MNNLRFSSFVGVVVGVAVTAGLAYGAPGGVTAQRLTTITGAQTAVSLTFFVPEDNNGNTADHLYRYDASWQNSSFVDLASSGTGATLQRDVAGVSVVNSSEAYVLDRVDKRVYLYSLDGVASTSTPRSRVLRSQAGAVLGSPSGLAISGNGTSAILWLVDNGTNQVHRYALADAFNGATSDLSASNTANLHVGNDTPEGLAIHDNALYIAEGDEDAVYRYQLNASGNPETGARSRDLKAKAPTGSSFGNIRGIALHTDSSGDSFLVAVTDEGTSAGGRAFHFLLSAVFATGSGLDAAQQFDLAAQNKEPQGL